MFTGMVNDNKATNFEKSISINPKSHLPVVFENNDIPYVFVPSKHDLGASIGSKRPTCVLLIKPNEAYGEDLGKCLKVRIIVFIQPRFWAPD